MSHAVVRSIVALSVLLSACAVSTSIAQEPLNQDELMSLTIVNGTKLSVYALFVSQIGEESLAEDRLGGDILHPGSEITITLVKDADECLYNLQAAFEDYSIKAYLSFDACRSERLVLETNSSDLREGENTLTFLVQNDSDKTIIFLYVYPSTEELWGLDRLEDRVLEPGDDFYVKLEPDSKDCQFDVRVQFGLFGIDEQIYEGIDVCETDTLVVASDASVADLDVPLGTAFYVSADGKLITNYHVVSECSSINVIRYPRVGDPVTESARILAFQEELDLAILDIVDEDVSGVAAYASFRALPKVRLGEYVTSFGFPEREIMSKHGVVSTGVIAAMSGYTATLGGVRVNHNHYQTTAPVHHGNSGSPLLDGSGLVVGVLAEKIGETVAYAVKSSAVTSFLETHNIRYTTAKKGEDMAVPDVVESARKYVVPVDCSSN